MMHNAFTMHPWESEYRNPQFITLGTEPLSGVKEFMRWVKKQVRKNASASAESFSETRQHFSAPVIDWTVLDLGCGNGKNLKYIVENFCKQGIGYDISEMAIKMARELSGDLNIEYRVQSIGKVFPLEKQSVDLIIDATSSHALSGSERNVYLSEISRVLKPGGFVFLRTLAIEGDTNAKNLVKEFPGTEPNTYVLPGTGMTERVFSKSDLESDYSKDFEIVHAEKTSGYQKWSNQSYKRNYWIVYLQKK